VPLHHRKTWRIEVLLCVALGAFELRVLSFQLPARQRVIEFIPGRWPPHDAVIRPVMLGVAPAAIVIAWSGFRLCRVIAALFVDAARDFLMAIETLKLGRLASEGMALGALEWPFQIVVRLAERAGRHLRECGGGQQGSHTNQQCSLAVV